MLLELSERRGSELMPNPWVDLGFDELAHSCIAFAGADEVEAKAADAEDVETEDVRADFVEVDFAETEALDAEGAEADEGGDFIA